MRRQGLGLARNLAAGAVGKLWPRDLSGGENLRAAGEQLENGSLMVIFNHTFSGDVFTATAVCQEYFGNNIEKLLLPASKKHLDFGRAIKMMASGEARDGVSLLGHALTLRALMPMIGAEMRPIVQSHDINYYGEKAAISSWRGLLRSVKANLGEKGTVMVVAPEGTRSENGKLQKATRGYVDLMELGGENLRCLPIGVWVSGNATGRALKMGRRVEVVCGELFALADYTGGTRLTRERKREMADLIMKKEIVPLLPQEMIGDYYRRFLIDY